ncbi:MAG: AcrB/AcrD/AcrF family protein [Bacteroidetes bacterium QS_8_68_28]|jgi:HAE1 family hydrophobic/amphiphilic exporter-1|nr:MAG: AcrB/AcrD/AcrF family protein [Bacteroidetes bacterium QS_8_68_28]
MASITDTSIRRPVATAMVYLVILTVGVAGFRYLPVDLLPQIEYPRITVYTNYGNVGPEEMEKIITNPLENTLSGISNVERMTSSSSQGASRVSLEFGRGTNVAEAANEVRAQLDRVRDELPREASAPGIWKFDPNSQEIVTLSVTSPTRDLQELTQVLEREVRQRFSQIPGVGSISIGGGVYREIQVRLQRDRLKALNLTAAEVSQAIQSGNVRLPGGDVKEGLKNLYVRTQGEYETVQQIRNAVVATREEAPVRVKDVARVVNGYQDVEDVATLNGRPVVRLDLQKQSGANTVSVAQRIRQEVKRINKARQDLGLTVVSDQSQFIQKSIDSVRSSAIWGGLLAVLILYLFLRNFSTTGIIALSIPISMVATFGVLYFAGLTLNQMTFGGLALGIGLIVDNAIVVLENIVRLREEEDLSTKESASVGTREVVGAIVASTLTTSVIFLPVVFMRTTTGQLFQVLAMVVVFALVCSLFVALTLVPMLASRFLTIQPNESDAAREKSWFQRFFERMENRYADRLGGLLKYRYRVFGVAGVLVVGAAALWPLIPVELAPQTTTNQIDVEIEMARGTNVAVARRYVNKVEKTVRPLLPDEGVETVAIETRGDDAEVEIRLADADERDINATALADSLRQAVTGQIPGTRVEVDAQSGLWVLRRVFSSGGGGDEVQVQLRGYNLAQARQVAQRMKTRMERVDGVVGVRVGRREGRPQENIRFKRTRIARLGLSVEEVAQAVQTSVGGSTAGYFRSGGQRFPISVRLRPADRLTAQDLGNIAVKTPEGEAIPVSTLVTRQEGRGPTNIRHINGQRVTRISANLESGRALGEAVSNIRTRLRDMSLPDGFSVVYGGAYREQQQARQDFLIAILMALALVYMVMAGQFERFMDPLVVMFTVPVALVGVMPTLLLTGTTINMQSIMGLVMLIGIVVNNAIVLIDYVNLERRERGRELKDAVVEASRLRLRPILMTTLTTVLGLFPLALGLGGGANLQAPLARVVIGGLLASTFITLVLIPALYISASRLAGSVNARAAALWKRITARGRGGSETARA